MPALCKVCVSPFQMIPFLDRDIAANLIVVQLAYRMALVLRDLINPYLLRRQKKDIKEVNRMPGKTEQGMCVAF